MKRLAARFPRIDIDEAGIRGHSGGGYAAGAGEVTVTCRS
jgi:hypothetical protein